MDLILATYDPDGDPMDPFEVLEGPQAVSEGRLLVDSIEYSRWENITEEEASFLRELDIRGKPGLSLWQHLDEFRSVDPTYHRDKTR